MPLDLGAASYTYLYATDLDGAIDRIAGLGFRSCELMATAPQLHPSEVDSARRRQIRARLGERGLALTALNPTFLDINIASTNPDHRTYAIGQIRACIDLAADLGAAYVVVGTGRRHPLIGPPFESLYRIALDGIGECVHHAEHRGITAVLENIPTLFLERGDHLRRVCADIASERCQILYDAANGYMVEDPIDGLDAVAPFLTYVHLSDTVRDRWLHAPVGQGQVDFAAFTEKLVALGYTGPATLEVIEPDDPDAGFAESARRLAPLGWER